MVSRKVSLHSNDIWLRFGEGRVIRSAYLGNLSASKTTQLTPSRASAEAVYDPPGPPPTTNTVVSVGIDIVSVIVSMNLRRMERFAKDKVWGQRSCIKLDLEDGLSWLSQPNTSLAV